MTDKRRGVAEWRAAWQLPFVAMFATTGSSLVVYGAGVFMPLVTGAFGWSRAAFSSGFLMSTLVGLIAMPVAGRFADRYGPRPIALAGVVTLALAIAALGRVDGVLWHWWLLFALFALSGALVAPSILTMAVVSRFDATRGLALAVALSGTGLAAAIWPPLATLYTAALGWRLAYGALAASWAVVTFPLLLTFFRARRELAAADRPPPAPSVERGYAMLVRSRPFVCLVAAGTLFIMPGVAMLVNFVPILRDRGMTPAVAAGVAAAAGVSSIVGRILIGFLLDRFEARTIAVAAFLFPAVAAAVLLAAGGSVPLAILAAMLLGIGLGAEFDIATFLAARHFGLGHFSGVFGIIVACYGVAAGIGPLLGNLIYDRTHSYTPLLIAAVPLVVASAALIAALPREGERAPATA